MGYTAQEQESGLWRALKPCTRIQQRLTAYHVGAISHGVAFPGAPIEALTPKALQDELRRLRFRIVWA